MGAPAGAVDGVRQIAMGRPEVHLVQTSGEELAGALGNGPRTEHRTRSIRIIHVIGLQ